MALAWVQLFPLGKLVTTPGAMLALVNTRTDGLEFLSRHMVGDWGELDEEDKAQNTWAVTHGERILSAYTMSNGEKLWIITECDRSVTTLLLPSEY
jgi:hypothetical protein